LCVNGFSDDFVDAKDRAGYLWRKSDETLPHFASGELDCGNAILKDAPSGGVVIKTFAVHDVFDADSIANTAHNMTTIRRKPGPSW
jgi:hypothetical protein